MRFGWFEIYWPRRPEPKPMWVSGIPMRGEATPIPVDGKPGFFWLGTGEPEPMVFALERKVGDDWHPCDGGLFAGDDEQCTAEQRCHRHKGWMEKHFVDDEFRVMAYRRVNAK